MVRTKATSVLVLTCLAIPPVRVMRIDTELRARHQVEFNLTAADHGCFICRAPPTTWLGLSRHPAIASTGNPAGSGKFGSPPLTQGSEKTAAATQLRRRPGSPGPTGQWRQDVPNCVPWQTRHECHPRKNFLQMRCIRIYYDAQPAILSPPTKSRRGPTASQIEATPRRVVVDSHLLPGAPCDEHRY